MRHRVTLSLLAATGLTAGLLVVSPKTCSCTPPRDELAVAYELKGDPTPTALQAAAEQMFKGKDIRSMSPPLVSREEECSRPSEEEIVCNYWLDEGILRESGLRLMLRARGSKTVNSITVGSASRWFGG